MSSTPRPALWRERTALAWQRSGLSLAVVAALLLRRANWPAAAAAIALAAAAILATSRHLGARALALTTVGAALVSIAVLVT
jgi:hypothetical protein